MRLEDLTKGAVVSGIVPSGTVTVIDVRWFGTAAVEITYKTGAGTTPIADRLIA